MSSENEKQAQRLEYRCIRDRFVDALSPQDRALAFSKIPSPLKKYLGLGKIVAGYVAVGSEVDPAAYLTEAYGLGCEIALPHVTSKVAPMRFLRWRPGEVLVRGPFGLQQPADDSKECAPDIVLVPLVAFDDRLMRLGQGAGHYDRALSLLDQSVAIGLAWSVQHAPALETDIWDVPLDAILTEKSWITL
ncbi:5-formyltetrahydrofolate cyclo-ligase [Sphingorhabdus sp.]|uniref:5-formyltetrahydrofolate cyclo-ligase n=1 Tax=Sphingorhabdus sp. TaxID=1902408 RepID=UPI00391C0DDF